MTDSEKQGKLNIKNVEKESMGALPKRRISSGRRGRRRIADDLKKKIVKHHIVSKHKNKIMAGLKKALGMAQ